MCEKKAVSKISRLLIIIIIIIIITNTLFILQKIDQLSMKKTAGINLCAVIKKKGQVPSYFGAF